jgi:serine/threonine protein kinase
MLDLTKLQVAPGGATAILPSAEGAVQRVLYDSVSGTTALAFELTAPAGESIAVKRYNLRYSEYLLRTPLALERLGALQGRRIPGLPVLVRTGMADGHLMLMSESVPGESLDQALAGNRFKFDRAAAAAVVARLSNALAAIHAGGLMHLDVRPHSILLEPGAKLPRFADWGHTVPIAPPGESPGELPAVGFEAAPYASAELLSRGAPDPRDDVYSLGCVAYELFTGEHPYGRHNAVDAAAANFQATPIAGLEPVQSEALLRAVALHREERTVTMDEIARAFQPQSVAIVDRLRRALFLRGAALGVIAGACLTGLAVLALQPSNKPLPSDAKPISMAAAPLVVPANEANIEQAADAAIGATSSEPIDKSADSAPSVVSPTQAIATPPNPAMKPAAPPPTAPRNEVRAPGVPQVPAIGAAATQAQPSAAYAQAVNGCPSCSCAHLHAKRFGSGTSLTWEEASFVINVCDAKG